MVFIAFCQLVALLLGVMSHNLYAYITLGDIFKTLEMRRFFKEFAIFSDGQNFGFQNKIRRIIFDVFLLIVTSSIHRLHDKLLI